MNIIALLKDSSIKRIMLSQEIQQDLKDFFIEKIDVYLNLERIDFSGDFKPEQNEVFKIENFELPFDVNSIQNPLNIEVLSTDEIENIYGLVLKLRDRNEIIFQVFDTRKILGNPKFFELVHNRNSFTRLDKKGLVIDGKIDGMYLINQQILLFQSFHNISRIFDMQDYYREATNEEINDFNEHSIIEIDDIENFYEIADTQVRKYLYLIQKNGILDNLTDEKRFIRVKNFAAEFELGDLFDENRQKITIFTQDKKKVKSLLKFLNENMYESPITDNKYETNSKRKII